MLNKTIKGLFTLVGGFTGFTLTSTVLLSKGIELYAFMSIAIISIIALGMAFLFWNIGGKIIEFTSTSVERAEFVVRNLTMYELFISIVGLILGLVVANLITVSISKMKVVGVPLALMINLLFGSSGVFLVLSKKNDDVMGIFKGKFSGGKNIAKAKILDTSVLIDGRILDIVKSGFVDGEIVVPDFVLDELRYLADNEDDVIRQKGRRGLDTLRIMQKDEQCWMRIEKVKKESTSEVDKLLLQFASEKEAAVVTNDYNLNKVATIKGITILNINDLANAIKPIAISGEEMNVKVVKQGKENGQGVGYLEDGTMIVIENGSQFKGDNIKVIVTSVLQTSAGRMIFAKANTSIQNQLSAVKL